MKKIATLLTVIMTVVFAGSLNAAAYTIERGSGNEKDVIIISGQSASAVTVTVLKAGTDKDAIKTGEIYLTEIVHPDSSGNYVLKWLPLEDGEFDIYVSDGGEFERHENYYYFREDTRNNLLTMLATCTEQEMIEEEIFAKSINLRILEQDMELYEAVKDKDCIPEAIVVIREGLNSDESIGNYIHMALLQAALQENADAELTDALIKELVKLSGKEDLGKFYNTNISKDTGKEAGRLISDELPANVESLYQKTKEAVIVAGVNNEGNWAGIRKFMDFLGYKPYDNSSRRDDIDKLLVKETAKNPIKDIDDLKSRVDDAVKGFKKPSGGSTGGSSGGASGGGGGSYSGGGGAIAAVDTSGLENTAEDYEDVVFSDVFESDWYYDAVNYLRWKGIVQGYLNNFYPHNNVTRAELVTMLKNAFGTGEEEVRTLSFGDVNVEDWFYADVTAAANAGLVNGDGENFRPDDFVTRQDMAVMLKRFAENSGVIFDGKAVSFEDSGDVADYAADAVATLAGNGVVQGTGSNKFEPLSHAARSEIAQVIYRVVNRN